MISHLNFFLFKKKDFCLTSNSSLLVYLKTMIQVPADCLNEIFEYLENDKFTLYSCILVNRLWCEVSVRFLWRDDNNYKNQTYNTLISCLPNESKEILYKNGINIPTLTFKPPMFNYAAFCKFLSIDRNIYRIYRLLQKSITSHNLDNITNIANLVVEEIFKMLMNQISSGGGNI